MVSDTVPMLLTDEQAMEYPNGQIPGEKVAEGSHPDGKQLAELGNPSQQG